MTIGRCVECGSENNLAYETCRACGAELSAATGKLAVADTESTNPQPEDFLTTIRELRTTPIIHPRTNHALGTAFELYKNNIWLITKIVFGVFAPFEILKSLSLSSQRQDAKGLVISYAGLLFCKALVAPSVIFALITVMRTGVAPSVNESYRWGLSRLGRLMVCALLAWIAEAIGFVCLLVPGFILAAAFELIYPIIALEEVGPIETLKRSFKLTKGYRLNIFGITFLAGLAIGVVGIPIGLIESLLLANGTKLWWLSAGFSIVRDIVNEATTVLSLVFYLSILTSRSAPK